MLPGCSATTHPKDVIDEPNQSIAPVEVKAPTKLVAKVFIDDKFSQTERLLVEDGVQEWERATNEELIYIPQIDPVTHIVHCTKDIYVARVFSQDKIVLDTQRAIKEYDGSEVELAGYATPTCAKKYFFIVADEIDTDESFIDVTMHEMGHILGMQHTKQENMTVMYPSLDKSAQCLTHLDMVQFTEIWHADIALMRPCPY